MKKKNREKALGFIGKNSHPQSTQNRNEVLWFSPVKECKGNELDKNRKSTIFLFQTKKEKAATEEFPGKHVQCSATLVKEELVERGAGGREHGVIQAI